MSTSITPARIPAQSAVTTSKDVERGKNAEDPESNKNEAAAQPPKYARGQPRVAGFMSCGIHLAVFRKFDRMAYGSILHQQTQLLELESEIDEMNARDEELINLVPKLRTYLRENGMVEEPLSSSLGKRREGT